MRHSYPLLLAALMLTTVIQADDRTVQVPEGSGLDAIAAAPDGTVFLTVTNMKNSDKMQPLMVTPAGGTQNIYQVAGQSHPEIIKFALLSASPTNNSVAFVAATQADRGDQRLMLFRAADRKLHDFGMEKAFAVGWSGKHLVFSTISSEGNVGPIHLVDSATGDVDQLKAHGVPAGRSLSGTMIFAYIDPQNPTAPTTHAKLAQNGRLAAVDRDGKVLFIIAVPAAVRSTPVQSPGGNCVAWRAETADGPTVFLYTVREKSAQIVKGVHADVVGVMDDGRVLLKQPNMNRGTDVVATKVDGTETKVAENIAGGTAAVTADSVYYFLPRSLTLRQAKLPRTAALEPPPMPRTPAN